MIVVVVDGVVVDGVVVDDVVVGDVVVVEGVVVEAVVVDVFDDVTGRVGTFSVVCVVEAVGAGVKLNVVDWVVLAEQSCELYMLQRLSGQHGLSHEGLCLLPTNSEREIPEQLSS